MLQMYRGSACNSMHWFNHNKNSFLLCESALQIGFLFGMHTQHDITWPAMVTQEFHTLSCYVCTWCLSYASKTDIPTCGIQRIHHSIMGMCSLECNCCVGVSHSILSYTHLILTTLYTRTNASNSTLYSCYRMQVETCGCGCTANLLPTPGPGDTIPTHLMLPVISKGQWKKANSDSHWGYQQCKAYVGNWNRASSGIYFWSRWIWYSLFSN